LDARIYQTNIQFWAVLGNREKNPNCHKYATFEVSVFMFLWANNFFLKGDPN
jgi:hypothetical protein